MAKSDRLLKCMQVLRTMSPPVTAITLCEQLEVSQRTIYRDIDSLRAAGAMIDGEAGYGYTLVEDPALPPMIFTTDEIEALVLGLREVREIGDPVLASAAQNVMSKINAGLPKALQAEITHSVLRVKHFTPRPEINIDVAQFRALTRREQQIEISYSDAKGIQTVREIQPLAIVYMNNTLVVVAVCLLRRGFRAFRMDRIRSFVSTGKNFRPRRVSLLREAMEHFKNAESGNTSPPR